MAIISLVKSSRTDKRQAGLEAEQSRLAKLQIAEHEIAAEARTKELVTEELGRLFVESFKESDKATPGQPKQLPEGGDPLGFFRRLEKMSPTEQLEYLRRGRDSDRMDAGS